MNVTSRMDGSVAIRYEARQYPNLFGPYQQKASCRQPSDDVVEWLRQHKVSWSVVNYSFMYISFPRADIAALFRLTFA